MIFWDYDLVVFLEFYCFLKYWKLICGWLYGKVKILELWVMILMFIIFFGIDL